MVFSNRSGDWDTHQVGAGGPGPGQWMVSLWDLDPGGAGAPLDESRSWEDEFPLGGQDLDPGDWGVQFAISVQSG